MLLISLCLLAVVSATRVDFRNHCGHDVPVIRTGNNQGPVQQCYLRRGQGCSAHFNRHAMNFKNGWRGLTLAEFSFNPWNNLDFYDLSVIVGYDTAMQISTNTGGPTVTCRHTRCPEAYLFPKDDTKTKSTRTGGAFVVTFCP